MSRNNSILIIDDEEQGRTALIKILTKYVNIEILGEASGRKEAVEKIDDLQPDIILLDIQLGDGTGFDVLKEINHLPKVIFATAFDDYAIKAFKFSAIDYILKPINPLELVESVNKAIKQLNEADIRKPEQNFNYDKEKAFEKLVLPSQNGFEVIDLKKILAVQSENNYSIFYLLDGSQKVVSKTLKYYDEILRDEGFFRCHQKNLINLQHIVKYHKGEGGAVELKGSLQFDVSRRKKEELLERISDTFRK